jgi:hypothetical protein
MPRIALAEGASVHCILDDFLWPWVDSTPVLLMHGFARNARFWNRWVPEIAETHRVYRPDLLGCGLSDQPPNGYRYTPETIGAGPGNARRLVLVEGALGWRILWRDHRSAARRGASRPHRQPGACNTSTRIPEHIKRNYALGHASASEAMRASGIGAR